ncbi:uncharacterized protein LOC126845098 [Adelges cooleyi]|uniref:uncharacterized protein LOC126845098 n=1 Tax=Adelges cooleyi TaxID=133065 RepID=UPI00217FEC23|nr:uncharacterized protein LOC126845098 [Adelges cooleyi]
MSYWTYKSIKLIERYLSNSLASRKQSWIMKGICMIYLRIVKKKKNKLVVRLQYTILKMKANQKWKPAYLANTPLTILRSIHPTYMNVQEKMETYLVEWSLEDSGAMSDLCWRMSFPGLADSYRNLERIYAGAYDVDNFRENACEHPKLYYSYFQ